MFDLRGAQIHENTSTMEWWQRHSKNCYKEGYHCYSTGNYPNPLVFSATNSLTKGFRESLTVNKCFIRGYGRIGVQDTDLREMDNLSVTGKMLDYCAVVFKNRRIPSSKNRIL